LASVRKLGGQDVVLWLLIVSSHVIVSWF